MKYLFFDIECSNCFNGVGKMCEYGFVLTDENFNIIKQDDIPMSPGKGRECRFNLIGRKHEKDLELAYDYDFYFEQPQFPHFYERIKKLMEDPDTYCFAFSAENDILHLYHSCKRYKLEQIKYRCFDVQKFAQRYLGIRKQIGLKNACLNIVGPSATVTFNEHLSRDDAKTTMKIFQAICELEQMTSQQYLKEYPFFGYGVDEYLAIYEHKKEEKRITKESYKYFDSIKLSIEEASKEEYAGRRYEVSSKLKKSDDILKHIVEYVNAHNGVLIEKVDLADYFIVLGEDNKQEIIDKVGKHFNGEYILLEDIY